MRVVLLSLRLLSVVVLLAFSSLAAMADTTCPTAQLNAGKDIQIDLGPFACVYEDQDRALGIADILSEPQSVLFEPANNGLVDFSFGSARFWVRVRLHNADDTPGTWWITHDIPSADLLRVRQVTADGSISELLNLKSDAPFTARPIPHRHLASSVSLAADETVELVFDYVTGQGTQMPLMAESVASFVKRTQNETASHLTLIAILLGMGIISTLYFYSLEGPPALIYGAYVVSVALWLGHMEGYGFQFLYPNATKFNTYAYPMVGFSSFALGILFVARLTRTRQHSQLLNGVVLGTSALLIVMVVVAPFWLSTVWYKMGGLGLAVASYVVQLVVIIGAIRRGYAASWMLLLGFMSTFIAILLLTTGYVTEGLFPQELAGSALRVGFLMEAFAFSGAIALRVREARRARDHSLREQLRLSQESLHLSEAVLKAEAERKDAEQSAERSRVALSSAAHDIRQPLTSIQMLLAEGQSDPSKITGNLSYIEDILREGLEGEAGPLGTGSADPMDTGAKERFPAQLILDNLAAMFADEARSKGVTLVVMPCSAHIVADPLSLMRVASNLVSNALSHAQGSKILIGCRRMRGAVRIEVHDNGKGMSSEELVQFAQRGAKNPGSQGNGLGLSIAKELAQKQSIGFELRSEPSRGTTGIIKVPTRVKSVDLKGAE